MSPTDEEPTPPSLLLYFDASVLYADDNATPTSAAVGFLVEDGSAAVIERSMRIDAFVSSAHLEYRALLEAVRAVEAYPTTVASLHVHGDADAVLRAVDPQHHAMPEDRVAQRRVESIREWVADIPVVTYRAVGRGENERAHELARAGHGETR
ncbi:reverse transcriptase-like protein [Haloarcula nitratireducens]|uniref:Reverse transcriptase-like protein n=1 Tax=Haloarcula nitratireducens TaxID=2487749 RepID=A0AAW4PH87_9EURY|nr:reverse transcriptase-like protein [Halomicroarcula nitratireducens]MBX0297194.1 reverse transcriptase-like protein [Halomicroarcula nitratireducens]